MLRGIKSEDVADAVVKDLLKAVEYVRESDVNQSNLLYNVSVLYWRIRSVPRAPTNANTNATCLRGAVSSARKIHGTLFSHAIIHANQCV